MTASLPSVYFALITIPYQGPVADLWKVGDGENLSLSIALQRDTPRNRLRRIDSQRRTHRPFQSLRG